MKSFSVRNVALFVSLAFAGAAAAEGCKAVGTEVSKAVAETPAKVLIVVDEAITAHSECACEIVKAAISASDADQQLVGEIVSTAASAAPEMAAAVAECAVAEAPEASSAIKAALEEVFAGAKSGGGKSVVYDDGYSAKGGKEIVVEDQVEEVEEDFGPEPVVISGVYLIAPSASSSGGFAPRDRDGNLIDAGEVERNNRLIEILRRRGDGGRDSDGSTTSSGSDPSETDMRAMRRSTGSSSGSFTSFGSIDAAVGWPDINDVIGGFEVVGGDDFE